MVFDVVTETSKLLSVLPDVNANNIRDSLRVFSRKSEGQETHTFLQNYFKKKDENVSEPTLEREAKSVVKLFPYYSVQYVKSRLQILGSEKNRVTIVLRQLLAKESKNDLNKKRKLPQEQTHTKKYCTEETSPNDAADHIICNILDRPSTSKDYSIFQPRTATKPATIVSKSQYNLDALFENAVNASTLTLSNETSTAKSAQLSDEPDSSVVDVAQQTFSNVTEASSTFSDMQREIAEYLEQSSVKSTAKSSSSKCATSMDWETQGSDFKLKPATFTVTSTSVNHNNAEIVSVPNENESSVLDRSSGINLVKYLKEMFQDKTENCIRKACAKFKVGVSSVPCDEVMDALVQHLMDENETKFELVDQPIDLSWTDKIKADTQATDDSQRTIDYDLEVFGDGDNEDDTPAVSHMISCNREPHAYNFRFRIEKVDNNERRLVQIQDRPETPPSVAPKVMNSIDLSETDSDDYESSQEDNSSMDVDLFKTDQDKLTEVALQKTSYDKKLTSTLMEMFPDACPHFIRSLCIGKTYSHEIIDEVMNKIFSNPDYPKRRQRTPSPEPDLDPEDQFKMLKEILPDADPNFLRYHAELYANNHEKLKTFIAEALENRAYPTMKEYLRKKQLSAQEKQYTTEFRVEKFLDVIPDPKVYFNDPQRKSSISEDTKPMSYYCACKFLKNMFTSLPVKLIRSVFIEQSFNLVKTKMELDNVVKSGKGLMKTKRKPVPIKDIIQDIPLLQEMAYLEHMEEITHHIEENEKRIKEERDSAKAAGLLVTCNCCFDDEVMPNDIQTCENGCEFCRTCIQKSVEVAFGEGKLDFGCLGNCQSHFSLQTLRLVLSPKLFSKMAQKKQLEEVKAAGIEDLEMCPFCDFATIPPPGDKIFRCLNPDCMKESCRECKEPSHVPLRCDEIEKDDDVRRRIYIENKMTEALLRKCYKCGTKFIKADGCNKMTCSCGATMCYVCGAPVEDYAHFNGQGGDKYHLCPLYSDTNKLHQDAVLKGAEDAKAEIGATSDASKLKIDPSADIKKHYRDIQKRNPQPLPPGMVAHDILDYIFDRDQHMHHQFFPEPVRMRANRHLGRHRHHHHRNHHEHYPGFFFRMNDNNLL